MGQTWQKTHEPFPARLSRNQTDGSSALGGGPAGPPLQKLTYNVGFVVRLPNRRSFSPDAAFTTEAPLTGKFIEGAPVFAAEVRSEDDYGAAAERTRAANAPIILRRGPWWSGMWTCSASKASALVVGLACEPDGPGQTTPFARETSMGFAATRSESTCAERVRESELDQCLARDADTLGFLIDGLQQVDREVHVHTLDCTPWTASLREINVGRQVHSCIVKSVEFFGRHGLRLCGTAFFRSRVPGGPR